MGQRQVLQVGGQCVQMLDHGLEHALPADLEHLTLAPDAESAATILSERLRG